MFCVALVLVLSPVFLLFKIMTTHAFNKTEENINNASYRFTRDCTVDDLF